MIKNSVFKPIDFTFLLTIVCLLGTQILFAQSKDKASDFLNSEQLKSALFKQNWKAVIEISLEDSSIFKDSRVLLLSAHAYYALGQNNAAAYSFTKVSDSVSLAEWKEWTLKLSIHHNTAVAHYLYGDALARNAEFDTALIELSKAINLQKGFCLAFMARGAVYDILGSLDSAFVDFERVRKNCPDFADVYTCIGVNYLQRGIPSAGKYFDMAIALDSTHALTYNGLACYDALKGNLEKAQKDIITASRKLNENPYIVINAKALTSSSDTTSILGKIANLKGHEQGIRGFELKTGLGIDIGAKWKNHTFNFNAMLTRFNAKLDLAKRKGVYFDLVTSKNLLVNDSSKPKKFATDFVIGYPRSKK